ncbi:tail fiber domain-containing protein [Konateibacter massiliensis]|uniref:tail fiber domain-containing protein n=1 Tax=Konateibacter massiliensis TaxID=2002841 RepID=UPI000C149199|nr:tail fiber domain-containing protein [Konateibacter massiliensis]
MEITEHGLKKPANDDFYNIEDFNENAQVLEEHLSDSDIHVNAKEIAEIEESEVLTQIGVTDTNGTLWGKVKKLITDFLAHKQLAASSNEAGHVKLSDIYKTKEASGAAVNGMGASQNALYGAYNELNTNLAGKAPTNHASTATTYGIGTATNYGHVKLSDSYTASGGAAAAGVGASSLALYNAYTTLNNNKSSISHTHAGIWQSNYHVGLSADGLNFRMYINGGDGSSAADNTINLGSGSYRWKQVYAGTGTISTSDRNYKDNINELTEKHMKLFMMLKPVSFTFRDGDSGRVHIGFIAQDVEEAMQSLGMTAKEFAGFCKDVKVISGVDNEGNIVEIPVLDNEGNPEYIYSLRYDEFIALTVHVLQKIVARIENI